MKIPRVKKSHALGSALLMSALLIGPTARAEGFRSTNRSGSGNSSPNLNIDHRPDGDFNRPTTRDIKRPPGNPNFGADYIYVDVEHHHGFWAGLATGAIVGSVLDKVPPRARRLKLDGVDYYYLDGSYYQESPSGCEVVQPPVGTFAAQPPAGSIPVVQGAYTYYYFNGTFYLQQGNVFKIVPAPIGVTVPVLPSGAKQVMVGGAAHYLANGVHYRPSFQNGTTVFTTVKA